MPVLFSSLDDRALAGTLAGKLFHIMSYAGLVCGSLLLAASLYRHSGINSRAGILLLMLALIVLGEFVVSPMITGMREAGAVDSSAFARAHTTASVLFLITSLLGLYLVATANKAGRAG